MTYMLFGRDNYYADGGWRDFLSLIEAETLDEAKEQARTKAGRRDWWHLTTLVDGVVAEGGKAAPNGFWS